MKSFSFLLLLFLLVVGFSQSQVKNNNLQLLLNKVIDYSSKRLNKKLGFQALRKESSFHDLQSSLRLILSQTQHYVEKNNQSNQVSLRIFQNIKENLIKNKEISKEQKSIKPQTNDQLKGTSKNIKYLMQNSLPSSQPRILAAKSKSNKSPSSSQLDRVLRTSMITVTRSPIFPTENKQKRPNILSTSRDYSSFDQQNYSSPRRSNDEDTPKQKSIFYFGSVRPNN